MPQTQTSTTHPLMIINCNTSYLLHTSPLEIDNIGISFSMLLMMMMKK